MKRNAIEGLIRWKASEERKPLVLKGAAGGKDLADEGIRKELL